MTAHRFAQSADETTSDGDVTAATSHICCGRRLRQIDIDADTSALTFTFCGSCEQMQWFADGVLVSRDHATTLAGAMPARKRRVVSQ